MKSMPRPSFLLVGGLIVLICTVLWFYLEWDLKAFTKSLGALPQRTDEPQVEHLETNTTSGDVVDGIRKQRTNPIAPDGSNPEAESPTTAAEIDMFLDELQQITETPVTSKDASESYVEKGLDVDEDVDDFPYDIQQVKAGFEDYNTYLSTHPEYAYQRLDDAFREQFGDDPDVDILVESIRSYNNGPVPVDTAIRFTEAELRLFSKFGAPEPIAELRDTLEMLREAKEYALESGEESLYRGRVHIGGEDE